MLAILVMITGVLFYACKDNLINETADRGSGDKASARLAACTPIPLSGVYTSPLNLTSGNTYLLQGNVVIDGTTITIDDGVTIFGEKATNGALIVLPDASINASGTSTSPIIFTSDQVPGVGNRAPGDWAGVYLLGAAPNNASSALNILINGTTYTAGGATPAGSIGTFQYVQIHFAGGGGGMGSDRLSESSLIIASAGSSSVIDHVQVTESARDGVGVWGGSANLRNVINYKVKRTDYMFSYGYTGTGQFLGGHKAGAIANTTNAEAFGIDISNDFGGSGNTPLTNPSLSNVSLLGGDLCEGDVDFEDAIVVKLNGNSAIRNSVISSYSQNALLLSGADVIGKTPSSLTFSYNSFHQITNSPQYSFTPATPSWSSQGGCGSSMTQWMTGNGTPGCSEFDNQFTVSTLGYNTNSLCSACPFTPDFALNTGTTTLDDPNFEDWSSGAFTVVAYRGAFGSADWTLGWTDFCALDTEYCV